MPREYKTKGRDRRTNNFTTPMTDDMMEALRKAAEACEVSAAEMVRQFIERGLKKKHLEEKQ